MAKHPLVPPTPTSASSTRRVGLLARATHMGLGHQTRNFYDGYRPDATLVVCTGATRWKDHLEWYPGAHVAELKRDRKGRESLVGDTLTEFMSSIDVLFTVETLYAWSFVAELRNRGIHTVIQGNPEFYRPPGTKGAAPEPHEWVLADGLDARRDAVQHGAPGARHRALHGARRTEPPTTARSTFVHVAGQPGDRRPQRHRAVLQGPAPLPAPCKVRLYGQDGEFRRSPRSCPATSSLEST